MGTDDLMKRLQEQKFDFSKIQMPKNEYATNISKVELPQIEPIPIREHMEKTEQYQEKSLQILEAINQNTANLFLLVDLINKSNEKQDIIIELISEILSISKAKNKEEAKSLYSRVMSKITSLVEDGETLYKICGYATTVYSMVSTFFK